MDIENSLSDFRVSPLSDYASMIRYVKLEMTEGCLVTQSIKKIYLEKGKLFVYDNEPFKETVYKFEQWREITNNNIYGIYDKDKRQLHFLFQPIPGVRGLKNDLDGGIPFWPKSISSDFQKLDYYHAATFLELAEKVENPDQSFLEFVQTCSEEDNPVVIIVE